MPALDFPANPTNGQAYANWIYSTSKGAWQAKPMTNKVTTSGVAPASPSNGDEWYNTEDGNIYVYYNDGTSAQWVQVKSDATLSSTLGNRVTSLEAVPTGLVDLIPASVTVGSGSATVNSTGNVTFTGASSISLNDVFTSAYTNYHFNLVVTSASVADADIRARLRVSGSDASSAYYEGGTMQVAAALSAVNNLNITNWDLGRTHSATDPNAHASLNFKVFQPFQARPTTFHTESISWNNNNTVTFRFSGFHTTLSSYTGITIFTGSGTLGGTLQVYGYR